MHNPFHDELTPSTELERRIERALDDYPDGPPRRAARVTSGQERRWGRLAILGAVAVMPLIGLLAVFVVSEASLPLNVFNTGPSHVPPGTGHSAPLFNSTAVATVTVASVATDAALVPTPTIVVMPEAAANVPDTCTPVNAAGTPVARPECPPTPTPTPAPSSHARPAPRHASAR